MKEKIYGVCLTKVFREESYGQPEITLCKTREIAHREFIDIVSNRLDDWLPDEYEDEDRTFKDFMTVEQKVQSLKDEGYNISFGMDEYNEFLEFATSDESSTSVRILETEMITE